MVICTDWFLTRELCAEVVVLRDWWRFYKPIWERVNFVWAGLHCQEPFCFVLLMFEQYGDLNHLHIIPPETHLQDGFSLQNAYNGVPSQRDIGSKQDALGELGRFHTAADEAIRF